ncbi:hypothetical protein [Paenisporosarcina macmurdoensis]|uniref:hypothetical protein n=1 Tax=Paenisporosarcina macmurdoensis TaxID=212659 RepID=UPI003673182B
MDKVYNFIKNEVDGLKPKLLLVSVEDSERYQVKISFSIPKILCGLDLIMVKDIKGNLEVIQTIVRGEDNEEVIEKFNATLYDIENFSRYTSTFRSLKDILPR